MAEKPAASGKPRDGPRQPTEEELRELMMCAEQVRQQLGTLETQREYLLELLTEARRSAQTVEHLKGAKDGDELLVPIGAGTYVAGKLANNGKTLTSLGSGIHAELPAEAAHERLQARVKILEDAASAVGKDIAKLSDEMMRLNAVAESVYGG